MKITEPFALISLIILASHLLVEPDAARKATILCRFRCTPRESSAGPTDAGYDAGHLDAKAYQKKFGTLKNPMPLGRLILSLAEDRDRRLVHASKERSSSTMFSRSGNVNSCAGEKHEFRPAQWSSTESQA